MAYVAHREGVTLLSSSYKTYLADALPWLRLLLGGLLQHLVDPGLPAWTCSLEILENGR
jgi:hypothetical protein